MVGHFRTAQLGVFEGRGHITQRIQRISRHADGRMRTHHHALVALDAQTGIPHGNFLSDIAFLPARRRHRPGAVGNERTHGQFVTLPRQHFRGHALDKFRRVHGDIRRAAQRGRDRRRHHHLMHPGERGIHRGPVLRHHGLAFLQVGFLDGFLDGDNRLVTRQHFCEREEARLHDGVDLSTHASRTGDGDGIDDINLEL